MPNSSNMQMSDADIAEMLLSRPDTLNSPRAIQPSDLTAEQQKLLPEGADPLTVVTKPLSGGGECSAKCYAPRRPPAIPLSQQIPPLQLSQP